ncbi:protein RALF-like 24 [Malania oleifera]|uniref:protein RALF-like 24 n=1 Tax=Malania oleifera TaxID=397392 RepID=UPI0025ADC440|nr:protein RALF-like 24 [Malania oleifera]
MTNCIFVLIDNHPYGRWISNFFFKLQAGKIFSGNYLATAQNLNSKPHKIRNREPDKQRELQAAEMTKPKTLLSFAPHFSLILLGAQLLLCDGVPILGMDSLKTSEIGVMPGRVCGAMIGECLPAAEGAEMDSDTNRRVLAMRKKYISYETLRRDMVPCQRPGASYYNCHARQANPYNRGCEMITYCARNVRDTKT